jgi:hypothetical protein
MHNISTHHKRTYAYARILRRALNGGAHTKETLIACHTAKQTRLLLNVTAKNSAKKALILSPFKCLVATCMPTRVSDLDTWYVVNINPVNALDSVLPSSAHAGHMSIVYTRTIQGIRRWCTRGQNQNFKIGVEVSMLILCEELLSTFRYS